LNAITHAASPFRFYGNAVLEGVVLRALPCDLFNYSPEYGARLDAELVKNKLVIHLKGGRKSWIEGWLRVIDGNASGESHPPAGISYLDRKYSLDTTPPVEYEPATSIDFTRAELTELANHFKTDKGDIKHGYTRIYSSYLQPLRGKAVSVLEIGVACGSSLKMWASYFGPASRIIGIDIRPECANLCKNHDNIEIIVGDATSLSLQETLDVIIDDGSHVSLDIVMAFKNLWPCLKPGG
jgi:hypothetical protein